MEDISAPDIEDALERILAAETFKSAPKLQQFLTYIVRQKLAGKEADLKAYSIAIDVFGYSGDFDPQTDPIIRVQARRLRTALHEYYLGAGSDDNIIISVPRGAYRPQFSIRKVEQIVSHPVEISSSSPSFPVAKRSIFTSRHLTGGILAIAVLIVFAGSLYIWDYYSAPDEEPVSDTIVISMRQYNRLQSDTDAHNDAIYFFQNLRGALARNTALSIFLPNKTAGDNNEDVSVDYEISDRTDFIIDTNALVTGDFINLSVELLNARTNKFIWSGSYALSDMNDEMVLQIVRELNAQIFGESVEALEGRDPTTLTASQLFVLATWIPGPAKSTLEWEKERVDLARLALQKDPDFGPAYSVLADKLSYLAAVDGPSDTEAAAEEAALSAAKTLDLRSDGVNSLFNVAQHYWHSGQLDKSILMMKRVLELDPSHAFARFFSTVIPYTCKAAPEHIVAAAINFDQSLGVDNPARWVTLTWIGWLRLNRAEFEAALEAEERSAQIFQIPYTIMRHAAILNQLQRVDEAMSLLESQKSNWPNLDPAHFANVTMPRLCSGDNQGQTMIGFYQALADQYRRQPLN